MNDFLFKFVIIGDTGVGKSTLIKNYVGRVSPTIGVDFISTNLLLDGKNYKLHVWDTSGNKSFLNLIRIYFKSTIGVILVFDLGNLDSFNNIDFWIQQVWAENKDYKKIVLIGINRGSRAVSDEMIKEKCKLLDLDYFETSEDFHIEHCFISMTTKIMKLYRENPYIFRNLEGFKSNKPQTVNLDYVNFDDQWQSEEEKCDWCSNNCSIL